MLSNTPAPAAHSLEINPRTAPGVQSRPGGSIRTRMMLAAAMMVLLPILTIGGVLVLSSSSGSEQQLLSQLTTVVGYKENAIADWLRVLKAELGAVLSNENTFTHMKTLARLKARDPNASVASMRVGARFRSVLAKSDIFEEIFFVNMAGEVLVSSQPERQGSNVSAESYFLSGQKGAYANPPIYNKETSRFTLFISRPVRDDNGYTLGVLVARARFSPLADIMSLRWVWDKLATPTWWGRISPCSPHQKPANNTPAWSAIPPGLQSSKKAKLLALTPTTAASRYWG